MERTLKLGRMNSLVFKKHIYFINSILQLLEVLLSSIFGAPIPPF